MALPDSNFPMMAVTWSNDGPGFKGIKLAIIDKHGTFYSPNFSSTEAMAVFKAFLRCYSEESDANIWVGRIGSDWSGLPFSSASLDSISCVWVSGEGLDTLEKLCLAIDKYRADEWDK